LAASLNVPMCSLYCVLCYLSGTVSCILDIYHFLISAVHVSVISKFGLYSFTRRLSQRY